MSSNECSICASTFSSKLRKSIECIFCKKCCCKECFSTFMKDQSAPKCMFCNTEFTMDFVEENTTLKFMKEYNSHLCDLKFSVERSKLPTTQRLVEIMREKEKLTVDIGNKRIEIKYKMLENKRAILMMSENKTMTAKKIKEEKRKLKKEYNDMREEYYRMYDDIYRLSQTVNQQRNILTGNAAQPLNTLADDEKTFTRPCLATDCRGFLSKSYKCGTCDKYFCADCHETKQSRVDETHVCNEEAKATIALIVKDSKPCPKCSIPIEKVSGCSQMWCVSCHTTFDWNTMKIETGYIHNPEYLRWMRENNKDIPRNPYDNPIAGCNEMPYWYTVDTMLRNIGINGDMIRHWSDIHTRVLHINHAKRTMHYENNDAEFEYLDLRIDYLLSKISEESWRKKVGMLVKRNKLRQERYNVCDLYYNAMKDLFINVMEDKDFVKLSQSVGELEYYTNEQLIKINKKYQSKDKRFMGIKSI